MNNDHLCRYKLTDKCLVLCVLIHLVWLIDLMIASYDLKQLTFANVRNGHILPTWTLTDIRFTHAYFHNTDFKLISVLSCSSIYIHKPQHALYFHLPNRHLQQHKPTWRWIQILVLCLRQNMKRILSMQRLGDRFCYWHLKITKIYYKQELSIPLMLLMVVQPGQISDLAGHLHLQAIFVCGKDMVLVHHPFGLWTCGRMVRVLGCSFPKLHPEKSIHQVEFFISAWLL